MDQLQIGEMKKNVIILIGISLLMFILGYWLYPAFLKLSLKQISSLEIQFMARSPRSTFLILLEFALAWGLIPVLFYGVSKTIFELSKYQGIIVVIIILFIGFLFWQLRIRMLFIYSNFKITPDLPTYFTVSDLRFGRFIGLGFIIGAVISTFLFRSINKQKQNSV